MGSHLEARWRTVNHAQFSSAVAGGDSMLPSTLENMLAQLTAISDRIARVEDVVSAFAGRVTDHEGALAAVEPVPATATPSSGAAAPATASTLAGCLLNWYTNRIWETVQGKKEQNKRADAKAAVNIMKILYQAPCEIPAQPNRSDKEEVYEAWNHTLWTLAVSMDKIANERLHSLNGKKPTCEASSLRKRWRALRSTHNTAYKAFGAQYLLLQSCGRIVDTCAPASHQWTANDLS